MLPLPGPCPTTVPQPWREEQRTKEQWRGGKTADLRHTRAAMRRAVNGRDSPSAASVRTRVRHPAGPARVPYSPTRRPQALARPTLAPASGRGGTTLEQTTVAAAVLGLSLLTTPPDEGRASPSGCHPHQRAGGRPQQRPLAPPMPSPVGRRWGRLPEAPHRCARGTQAAASVGAPHEVDGRLTLCRGASRSRGVPSFGASFRHKVCWVLEEIVSMNTVFSCGHTHVPLFEQ